MGYEIRYKREGNKDTFAIYNTVESRIIKRNLRSFHDVTSYLVKRAKKSGNIEQWEIPFFIRLWDFTARLAKAEQTPLGDDIRFLKKKIQEAQLEWISEKMLNQKYSDCS